MIKAITSDLWNTLFQNISYTNERKSLINMFLERNGFNISDESLNQAFDHNFNFQNPQFKTIQFKHVYTLKRINYMLNELKIELEMDKRKEINNKFEGYMLKNPPELRKGVHDTLNILKDNYKIGMISDTGITPGRIIREILKDYNILDFFDVTVFSDETGFYKPHPIAFKTALNHLDCSPRNAIHIGDLLHTDIKGAIDYQMQAVWIRNPEIQNSSKITPDYEISEIPEILGIIDKAE